MKTYKHIIIGAGTAGLTARTQIAKTTDDYLVVDDGPLGTTCARVGCMPSKVLIQAANDFHRRLSLSQEGIHGGENLHINSKEVMSHVRHLRDRFVRGVLSGVQKWQQTHLVQKRATFIDQHTLDLDGEKIGFEHAIIATGSTPIIPEDWKPYSDFLITSDYFFEMESLPKKIAVVGIGVIGIELGQALHRLGIETIAIGRRDTIAGITDPELKDYTYKKFSEEMNIDVSGVKQLHKSDQGIVVETGEQRYTVDKILVTMGRRPNLSNMGLKNIAQNFCKKGIPAFDCKTFQLKDAPHIFIAGDVNGIAPILHESSDEGAMVGYRLANPNQAHTFDRRTPMGVTFSSPNIAYVGQTYASLKQQNVAFEIGEVSFEGQGRAIVMLKEKGMLRVYGCKQTHKILGAELCAPSGEHLAHLLAWAISAEMTVETVLSLPFYHPVVEEGLRTALRDLSKKLNNQKTLFELSPSNSKI